mgnify:CR=1 FL=1
MAQEKKELIRKSAISIFARQGYYNTTVQVIAEQAGVAVGTVYNYFTNKREILEYIFEVEANRRLGWLKELQTEDDSLQSKFVSFIDRHFTELKNNPDTAAVLVQESKAPNEQSLEPVNEFTTKLPNLFAELIETAKEKGEVRDVDSELIATAIFEALHGISEKVVASEEYDYEETKKEIINFYWLGLRK